MKKGYSGYISHSHRPGQICSFSPQIAKPEEIKDRWLPILLGPLATAQKLPGCTALVIGVAAGLSCMLGAPNLLPGFSAASEKLRSSLEAGNAILKVNWNTSVLWVAKYNGLWNEDDVVCHLQPGERGFSEQCWAEDLMCPERGSAHCGPSGPRQAK